MYSKATLENILSILRIGGSMLFFDKTRDKIFEVFRETAIMYKYDQLNYAHNYDLWEHSLHTVDEIAHSDVRKNDRFTIFDETYIAALLHDIGKPASRVPDVAGRTDENGNLNHFHYYNHADESVRITDIIIERLKEDKYYLSMSDSLRDICLNRLRLLVKYHDFPIIHFRVKDMAKLVKEGFSIYDLGNLFVLEEADAASHILDSHPKIRERYDSARELQKFFSGKNFFPCLCLYQMIFSEYVRMENGPKHSAKFMSEYGGLTVADAIDKMAEKKLIPVFDLEKKFSIDL